MYDEQHEEWPIEEMTIDELLSQSWIDAEASTVIPASEEVYARYTDTAGNTHWTGTRTGEHIIPADKEE